MTVSLEGGAGTDLDRREMFSDATSIVKDVPTGELTDAEYLTLLEERGAQYVAQLQQKGLQDITSNAFLETFEGELDPSTIYTYGENEDYYMGDVVQVEDEYGHEAKSRVIELVRSQEGVVVTIHPTFSTLFN
jgi:hypothetical protein